MESNDDNEHDRLDNRGIIGLIQHVYLDSEFLTLAQVMAMFSRPVPPTLAGLATAGEQAPFRNYFLPRNMGYIARVRANVLYTSDDNAQAFEASQAWFNDETFPFAAKDAESVTSFDLSDSLTAAISIASSSVPLNRAAQRSLFISFQFAGTLRDDISIRWFNGPTHSVVRKLSHLVALVNADIVALPDSDMTSFNGRVGTSVDFDVCASKRACDCRIMVILPTMPGSSVGKIQAHIFLGDPYELFGVESFSSATKNEDCAFAPSIPIRESPPTTLPPSTSRSISSDFSSYVSISSDFATLPTSGDESNEPSISDDFDVDLNSEEPKAEDVANRTGASPVVDDDESIDDTNALEENNSLGLILGVLGAVIVLLLVAIGVLLFVRSKRKQQPQAYQSDSTKSEPIYGDTSFASVN